MTFYVFLSMDFQSAEYQGRYIIKNYDIRILHNLLLWTTAGTFRFFLPVGIKHPPVIDGKYKNLHTDRMSQENRKAIRYDEIGKVTANELCAFPGILDNISATGCKVHFPLCIVVDLDNEYELTISTSRLEFSTPLKLLCRPMWVKECGGTTSIGFSILFSPDAERLDEYILYLKHQTDSNLPELD